MEVSSIRRGHLLLIGGEHEFASEMHFSLVATSRIAET
jgi:hypothetical protein